MLRHMRWEPVVQLAIVVKWLVVLLTLRLHLVIVGGYLDIGVFIDDLNFRFLKFTTSLVVKRRQEHLLFLSGIVNNHLITADAFIQRWQIDMFYIHCAIGRQILQVLLASHQLVRLTIALAALRLVVFRQVDLHDLLGAVITLDNISKHWAFLTG